MMLVAALTNDYKGLLKRLPRTLTGNILGQSKGSTVCNDLHEVTTLRHAQPTAVVGKCSCYTLWTRFC